MTKRNITVVGIVLILLIAIGITIVLSNGSQSAARSVGALQQPRTLNLKKLDLQQATLVLPLLKESSVELNHELKTELKSGLTNELKPALRAELKLLTNSANGLTSRLDLADHLLDVASASELGGNLHTLLRTV
jgi:hypothetical protein